jgi:hypothetical protein
VSALRKKAAGRGAPLVGQDLGVGEAGGVVDADVNELPAGRADLLGMGDRPAPSMHSAVAGDSVAGNLDAPQLLDVDVDELTGSLALVAVGRLGWLKTR